MASSPQPRHFRSQVTSSPTPLVSCHPPPVRTFIPCSSYPSTDGINIGGNISLNSTNPFDAPLINPNLLGNAVDLAIMREAVKSARAFVKAPAWSDYIVSEFGASANATTDEALDAFIRANADTFDHPVGSVAMGSGGKAPLTPDLRVRGTVGLRVVDASAFVSACIWTRVLVKARKTEGADSDVVPVAVHSLRAYPGSDLHPGGTRGAPRPR